MSKFQYSISDLRAVGVSDLEQIVKSAHAEFNNNASAKKSDDSDLAYVIYQYIIANNVSSLRDILDYVFANNLWSAWRRGQSTFKDLIKENQFNARVEREEIRLIEREAEEKKRHYEILCAYEAFREYNTFSADVR